MSIQFWYGRRFDFEHEGEDIEWLIKNTVNRFGDSDEFIACAFNFTCNNSDIDLAIFKTNGIAIIDFKRFSEPFEANENGAWKVLGNDSRAVIGNPRRNPFLQVRSYGFALKEYMKANASRFYINGSPEDMDAWEVRGAVSVSPALPTGSVNNLPPKIKSWFKLLSLSDLPDYIERFRNDKIKLDEADIHRFLRDVLHLWKYPVPQDWIAGQAHEQAGAAIDPLTQAVELPMLTLEQPVNPPENLMEPPVKPPKKPVETPKLMLDLSMLTRKPTCIPQKPQVSTIDPLKVTMEALVQPAEPLMQPEAEPAAEVMDPQAAAKLLLELHRQNEELQRQFDELKNQAAMPKQPVAEPRQPEPIPDPEPKPKPAEPVAETRKPEAEPRVQAEEPVKKRAASDVRKWINPKLYIHSNNDKGDPGWKKILFNKDYRLYKVSAGSAMHVLLGLGSADGKDEDIAPVALHRPKDAAKINDPEVIKITLSADGASVKATFRSGGGNWEENTDAWGPHDFAKSLETSVVTMADVVIIMDGTMDCKFFDIEAKPEQWRLQDKGRFKTALNLINSLALIEGHDLRFRLSFFGEYALDVHPVNDTMVDFKNKFYDLKHVEEEESMTGYELTEAVKNITQNIDDEYLCDGGDYEDCLELALRHVADKPENYWRENATRVLVTITESPPHPSENDNDYEPVYYCYKSKIDWKDQVRKLKDKNVVSLLVVSRQVDFDQSLEAALLIKINRIWNEIGYSGTYDFEKNADKIKDRIIGSRASKDDRLPGSVV